MKNELKTNFRSNGIRLNGVRSNGVSVKWPFGQNFSVKWFFGIVIQNQISTKNGKMKILFSQFHQRTNLTAPLLSNLGSKNKTTNSEF
jgi:hypothetical protein